MSINTERTIPIGYFEIRDCRDAFMHMETGQFDISITDPPYNIEKKTGQSSKRHGKGKGTLNRGKKAYETKDAKILFNDDWGKDFFGWVDSWFPELLRVCKGIVLTPGCAELANWICYRKPDYRIKIWHKPNAEGFNSHWEPLLFYGKIKNIHLLRDVITLNMPHYQNSNIDQYPHPAYKPLNFWRYLFEKLRPDSVLDPFLGTGTTIEVCEAMNIKYRGYEIKPEYESIIKTRQQLGMKERLKPRQRTLGTFITPQANG